jgi:outer membrane protein assembly factor BamD
MNYRQLSGKIVVCLLLGMSWPTNAHAYWIWTPKTQKWANPKTEVQGGPQEQLSFARGLFDDKHYSEAFAEFRKLLRKYPKAVEAAEGQYYLGRIEEERGRYSPAFQAYQKVVEKYPFSERIQEIIEREYALAERYLDKEGGIRQTVAEHPAIEMLTKVVENSSYGPLAAKAQYKLGVVLKALQRYYEAQDAFSRVVANYPDSEWVAPAQFQIASCLAAVSRGPAYDPGSFREAKKRFEEFLRDHPGAELSEQARANAERLRLQEAQNNYEVARFYEKQKNFDSAKIYYQQILDQVPESDWAGKALERLTILGAS